MKNWKLVAILAFGGAPLAAGLGMLGGAGCTAEATGGASGSGGSTSAGSGGSSGSAAGTAGSGGSAAGTAGAAGVGGASGAAGSAGTGGGADDIVAQLIDPASDTGGCGACLRSMTGMDKAGQIDCSTAVANCGPKGAKCTDGTDCIIAYATSNESNGFECHIFDCQNEVAKDPEGFTNEFLTCLLNKCSTQCGAGLDALPNDNTRPSTCTTSNPPDSLGGGGSAGGAGAGGEAGSAGAAGAAGAAGSGG